jgi:hypothetical protein
MSSVFSTIVQAMSAKQKAVACAVGWVFANGLYAVQRARIPVECQELYNLHFYIAKSSFVAGFPLTALAYTTVEDGCGRLFGVDIGSVDPSRARRHAEFSLNISTKKPQTSALVPSGTQ